MNKTNLITIFLIGIVLMSTQLIQSSGNHLNTNNSKPFKLEPENFSYNLQFYKFIDLHANIHITKGFAVDSDGYVYQTGKIYSSGNYDAILIKMDAKGDQIWNKTWGSSKNDFAVDLAIDSQNNIYVVGTMNCLYDDGSYWMEEDQHDKIFLIKYDSFGNEIWNVTWDNLLWARGRSISIDSADNIIIGGSVKNNGFDALLLKYNSSGYIIWERIFGWEGDEALWGPDIALDSDNNIYLGCNTRSIITESGDSDWNVAMAKFNESGDQIWNKTWIKNPDPRCYSVGVDSSGDLYVSGGIPDGMTFLLKYSSSGDKLWETFWKENNVTCVQFIEGISCEFYDCHNLLIDSNDQIYLTGSHGICDFYSCVYHDVVLLIYNKNGTLLYEDSMGFGRDSESEGIGIALNSNNELMISGVYYGVGTYMLLLKYSTSPSPFPGPFSLYHNTSDPDDNEGMLSLFWTRSSGADNYSLYMDTKYLNYPFLPDPITTTTDLFFTINLTSSNWYYFIVVAANETGTTPSNIHIIQFQMPATDLNLPYLISGYDLIFLIGIAVFLIVLLKRKKVHKIFTS